ncbi:hypothetical protein LIA77_05274 [Sarocladium implicatum]|nr:hypothetical protein LIA77_05274 [Sarocladium implicatum]
MQPRDTTTSGLAGKNGCKKSRGSAPNVDRTHDLRICNPTLVPLSYRCLSSSLRRDGGESVVFVYKKEWPRRHTNLKDHSLPVQLHFTHILTLVNGHTFIIEVIYNYR